MLDQNTDRMWFVIGAVIVGAAIIFIANGTIPELFASVTESFEEAAGEATNVMEEITPLGSEPTYYTFEGFRFYFPEESGTWVFAGRSRIERDYAHVAVAFPGVNTNYESRHVYITDVFDKPNTTYRFSFNAHRGGPWSEIDYELYLGDTRVGTFKAGQEEVRYSFDITSPTDINALNDLHFRSLHPAGPNAFWMSQFELTEL